MQNNQWVSTSKSVLTKLFLVQMISTRTDSSVPSPWQCKHTCKLFHHVSLHVLRYWCIGVIYIPTICTTTSKPCLRCSGNLHLTLCSWKIMYYATTQKRRGFLRAVYYYYSNHHNQSGTHTNQINY